MMEYTYNNAKNASTGYILSKLNCSFHPQVSDKKDVNPRSWSKSAVELVNKL